LEKQRSFIGHGAKRASNPSGFEALMGLLAQLQDLIQETKVRLLA